MAGVKAEWDPRFEEMKGKGWTEGAHVSTKGKEAERRRPPVEEPK